MITLDKRIKGKNAIYDCFDVKLAKEYIGKYGYFTHYMFGFANLDTDDIKYSKLTEVDHHDAYYPYVNADGKSFALFLPEDFVETKVKALRPYTIEEFQKIFTLGSPIKFRRKEDKEHPYNLIFLGYVWRNGQIAVEIGQGKYCLDDLFNDYEWFNEYKDEYTPFGVTA